MNIIVIGLGSMGKRRVRLIKQYIEKEKLLNWIVAGVDSQTNRCKDAQEECGIMTYISIDDAMKHQQFDAAVISTSPLSHNAIIKTCLNEGLHVFTEINLVSDGYNENMLLAKQKSKQLFLSSTPMYRREMEFITNMARKCKRGTYHYHIGQYLPDWHPWEEYNNFFVGNKRTNGCREIFAIELPWILNAFGNIVEMKCIHRKTSELQIDYDDTYMVQILHSSGIIGALMVDIVTPKAGREFEFYGEYFYCEWKGTPDSLKIMDPDSKTLRCMNLYEEYEHIDGYNNFVVENAYYDELVNYFNSIRKLEKPRYSFEKDIEVLDIIDKIEA